MGSGDRFKFRMHTSTIGLGVFFSKFPFKFTIDIHLFVVAIQLGFGKGYDE